MIKKYLILFTFLLTGYSANAEELVGVVADENPGASLSSEEFKASNYQGCFKDIDKALRHFNSPIKYLLTKNQLIIAGDSVSVYNQKGYSKVGDASCVNPDKSKNLEAGLADLILQIAKQSNIPRANLKRVFNRCQRVEGLFQ